MPQIEANPPRNAPCPCGSGKKYKHCCGLKPAAGKAAGQPASPKGKRDVWLIWLGVALVVAGTIFALISVNRRQASTSTPDVNAIPFAGTPQAWQFDAPNNRHWDPVHGHWHVGPPPAPEARK